MNWKRILLRYLFPIAITVAVVMLFFDDISLRDIAVNFLRIPATLLAGFIVLNLIATLLRAYKYSILLSHKLRFMDVFLITLVRNFSVDLLPARGAALLFYSYLTHKKGLSLEESASSFVISVFYDGLALSVMLGGLLFFLRTDFNLAGVYIAMAFIFALSAVMIFWGAGILELISRFPLVRRWPKLARPIDAVVDYLRGHTAVGERLVLFVLSFFIRLLKYLFIFLLFQGVVGLDWGLRQFSLFSFGLAGTELSSLLPIQGLGGFGTWELAFTLVFNALQVTTTRIREAAFVIHITTQVWEYAIGLLAFLYLAMQKKARRAAAASTDTESNER